MQSQLTSGERATPSSLLWRAARQRLARFQVRFHFSSPERRPPSLDSSALAAWVHSAHGASGQCLQEATSMGSFLSFLLQGPGLALPRPGVVRSNFMRGRDLITAGSRVTLKITSFEPSLSDPIILFCRGRFSRLSLLSAHPHPRGLVEPVAG